MNERVISPAPRAVAAHAPAQAPAQLFFSTPQQRLSLARQRFFEEGIRPTGLVSEAIIQSWSRCLQAHREPHERIAFNPVTASRVQTALAHSRLLIETAAGDLNQLHRTLAGTACTVILTDPQGVVVHAAWAGAHADEKLLPLARRIGVCMAEDNIGTNAPGLTARTGQPSLVLGGEHFFGPVHVMHCAAAPIHDVRGRIAGVLDLSSESRPFGFDAAAMVGMFATSIENRLLRAQSTEHIVVRLQTAPALIGTPMEGLVGITAKGRLAWVNQAAARLLGLGGAVAGLAAADVFGLELNALMAMTREPVAAPQHLPNGLTLWLLARFQARDGARELFSVGSERAVPPAAPGLSASAPSSASAHAHAPAPSPAAAIAPEGTLRERDHDAITRTLQGCGGNVSKAARQLGVSRGLVYRHLKRAAVA